MKIFPSYEIISSPKEIMLKNFKGRRVEILSGSAITCFGVGLAVATSPFSVVTLGVAALGLALLGHGLFARQETGPEQYKRLSDPQKIQRFDSGNQTAQPYINPMPLKRVPDCPPPLREVEGHTSVLPKKNSRRTIPITWVDEIEKSYSAEGNPIGYFIVGTIVVNEKLLKIKRFLLNESDKESCAVIFLIEPPTNKTVGCIAPTFKLLEGIEDKQYSYHTSIDIDESYQQKGLGSLFYDILASPNLSKKMVNQFQLVTQATGRWEDSSTNYQMFKEAVGENFSTDLKKKSPISTSEMDANKAKDYLDAATKTFSGKMYLKHWGLIPATVSISDSVIFYTFAKPPSTSGAPLPL